MTCDCPPDACVGGCVACAESAAASSAVNHTDLGDDPRSYRRFYLLKAAAAEAEAHAADLNAMAEESHPYPSLILTVQHYRTMAATWRKERDEAKRRAAGGVEL